MMTFNTFVLTLVYLVAFCDGRLHHIVDRTLQGVSTFENDNMIVKVTGNFNVPKYTFQRKGNATIYSVFFSKIFESKAGKKVGKSQISLPSLKWAFKDVSTSNETRFWINATDGPFDVLALYNKIINDTIKFDVILDGYQFEVADADAFNLVWKMSSKQGEGGNETEDSVPATKNETHLCWSGNDVCFSIVGTAAATAGTAEPVDVPVDITFSEDNDSKGIMISYGRFVGNLFHDPSFGFTSTKPKASKGFFARLLGFFAKLFPFLG